MTSFIRLGLVLAALAWSLLVWGTWALLALSGDFLAANASWFGLPAEVVQFTQQAVAGLEGLGVALLAGVWLIGMAGLAVLAWLSPRLTSGLSALLGNAGRPPRPFG